MHILERVMIDRQTGTEAAPLPLAVSSDVAKLMHYNEFTARMPWESVGQDRLETPKRAHGYWQIRWILELTQ